jgi:hypothetical protein
MKEMPPFTAWTALSLLIVIGCTAGTRSWYLVACADNGQSEPALLVQGLSRPCLVAEGNRLRARTPRELDNLAANVKDSNEFRGMAPLSSSEELTAHIAPGYPWLLGFIETWSATPDTIMRWLQCALGALTAGCYFFFTRRAFRSTAIATLTGLLIAFYPFWIVNTAELNDGVVTSFLLSLCLMLGTRGSQSGGAFTSVGFGLALAAISTVRAAFLPFSLAALLWFLWQSRRGSLGWFVGFLALFGFVNGLAPWGVRNYYLFDRPIPVATSTYLHLWMGNNPDATGSTLDEPALRASLGEERVKELLAEPNQAKRYQQLATDLRHEIENHPTEVLAHRFDALLAFVFGKAWFDERHHLGLMRDDAEGIAAPPSWVSDYAETILRATLLGLLLLALLGWRFSHAWRRYGRLMAIAAVWIPVPYLLSHAESLAGPRLPLDGVLLCFAAFALASFVPKLVRSPSL